LLLASTQIENKKLIRKLIHFGDFLTACELIKNNLGEAAFKSLIREEYLTPAYRSSKLHEDIFKLDSKIVLTTNFDKIYETFASQETQGTVIVRTHESTEIADDLRRPEPLIIKMHGSVDSNLIFTRKDYAEARHAHRDFYHILEALILTNTFVFVGCGLNDPDVRLILEEYSYRFRHSKKHYFVLPKASVPLPISRIIEDTMNLKMLYYSPTVNHKELLQSISKLRALVEAQRD
jgi:hypothetical protein